jgi:uncharacterized membrane protein YraQ (UPF0718 family)
MLKEPIDWLVHSTLGLQPGSTLGEAVHFFVYDCVKIILLLFSMVFAVGVLRSYIPRKKIKGWLTKSRFGLSYPLAALFGALTPFCSCSSIPIFISFIEAGIPLGPALTFLVTSPLINEYLAIMMLGFFGWKMTLAYIAFGVTLGVAAGLIFNLLKVEDQIVEGLVTADDEDSTSFPHFKDRLLYGLGEAKSIVRKLWVWVLIGVGIGALIHGFVPQEIIESVLGRAGVFSVPLAALVGIPIYANCSAVVPVASVLFRKGVPLGTALAFMMATAALSLPEAVILRRVMRVRLILLFFLIVGLGIIAVGYVFNVLEHLLIY